MRIYTDHGSGNYRGGLSDPQISDLEITLKGKMRMNDVEKEKNISDGV